MIDTLPDTPSVVDLPPTFIFDAAVGAFDLEQLCVKHDIPVEYADKLRESSSFQRALREQMDELDKTGVSFKVRSGLVADEALHILRGRIKMAETPTPVVLDAFKTLAKFAGREPVANAVQQGSGFSINIVFGDNTPKRVNATVENPPQPKLVSHDDVGVDPEFEYF